MPYDIRHLDNLSFDKAEGLYLLDSNIWLKILKPEVLDEIDESLLKPQERKNRAKDRKYREFFKKFSRGNKYKFAVPTLLISEIFNRHLREVAFKDYKTKNPDKYHPSAFEEPSFFKQKYRESEHFGKAHVSMVQDFEAFLNCCEIVNDKVGEGLEPIELLRYQAKKQDFNDNFYFLLARTLGIPVITDDSDFFVEGIIVYTLNDTLYQRGKNQTIYAAKRASDK